MANITYQSDTPIPSYFREHGWQRDHKAWVYICWAFSKCKPFKTKHYGTELDPFEFIDWDCHRREQTKLKEEEIYRIKRKLVKAELLEKVKPKCFYRTLVYRWNVSKFATITEDNPKITPIYEGWKYVGGENV